MNVKRPLRELLPQGPFHGEAAATVVHADRFRRGDHRATAAAPFVGAGFSPPTAAEGRPRASAGMTPQGQTSDRPSTTADERAEARPCEIDSHRTYPPKEPGGARPFPTPRSRRSRRLWRPRARRAGAPARPWPRGARAAAESPGQWRRPGPPHRRLRSQCP